MKRWDVINAFIEKFHYSNYLEIGFDKGQNFGLVKAKNKTAVDPAVECTYKMTSDDFFKQLDPNIRYDIVFIDGLHIAEQVIKDVENSLQHLADNGTIIIHDCNPSNEIRAAEERTTNKWNGTVYKAFIHFRMTRDDLSMYVVDTDHGCGVIYRGKQNTVKPENITYEFFDKNRKQLLNLTSIDEFKSKLERK